MPVISVHFKGAPEGAWRRYQVSAEQLRVLQTFSSNEETVPPCTARKLTNAMYTNKVVLVSYVRGVLNTLIRMSLVAQCYADEKTCLARLDVIIYEPTYDHLEVLLDRRP